MPRQPFRLDGRVALITGAGSATGIGNAIARSYSEAGCAVTLGDVDGTGAERNAAALTRAIGLRMDVTDETSVRNAVAQAEAQFGQVDILVNNAGITSATKIWDLTFEEFDRLLSINLRGGFLCLKAVLPGMMSRRYGRLIWISSISGKQGGGFFGTSHYAASKAGVIGLCQGAARELGAYQITSNAIAPGLVLTGLVARAGGVEAEQRLDARNRELVPLGRSAQPEDVAAAALYLASDEAAYVTGEVVDVNGGAYFD
jgi:3-oxoacyl-[acyl-carrier protein] reductase